MDFALTDDQLSLRDAVKRWCDDTHPAPTRGNRPDDALAARRHSGLAAIGLLGLNVDAELGGSGLGATETMLAAQELGRALAGDTWLGPAVLVAPLLAEAASPAQCARWLPALAQGSQIWALAAHDQDGRYDLAAGTTRAHREGEVWRLAGRKKLVLAGDRADRLLVLARIAGEAGTRDGLALFALPADQPGVTRQCFTLLDGRGAAHLTFDGARADILSPGAGHALAQVEAAVARGEAALCADSAGVLEALLTMTCEHLKTRRQFGAPLARFQVLQHQVADMAIALEQIKSMACVAALATECDTPAERDRLVSAAKTLTAQLGRRMALAAIQLHGAMGMTDECRVGHHAKRLITNGLLLGDASFHLRRFASHRPQDPVGDTS